MLGAILGDVVRSAVSLGGDCDTLTCIAAGIAEAFYGIPEEIEKECRALLPEDFLEILERFRQYKSGFLARGGGPRGIPNSLSAALK
ncbi:MAG: hypothetical protein K5668_00260 [Lachnospiraceae bacterium]|nr:hypothetical protein [Lachnospiraceae bacterium]